MTGDGFPLMREAARIRILGIPEPLTTSVVGLGRSPPPGLRAVDDLAFEHGQEDLRLADLVGGGVEEVPIQDDQVAPLPTSIEPVRSSW